jgi:chromosome segregation ATPase
MRVKLLFRRTLVVGGVLLSLFLGVATIQAAALWTAAASPLANKPPSIDALRESLVTAQERSVVLQTQLDDLNSGSADLVVALQTARDQIAADAAQAKELRASLKAAKTKLAALEKSIKRARSAATRVIVTGNRPATRAAAPAARQTARPAAHQPRETREPRETPEPQEPEH